MTVQCVTNNVVVSKHMHVLAPKQYNGGGREGGREKISEKDEGQVWDRKQESVSQWEHHVSADGVERKAEPLWVS